MAETPPATGLTREPIDAAHLGAILAGPADGAVATFVGVVRDNQDGRAVSRLEYEAHEPMAEAQLAKLARSAIDRWGLSRVVIEHRVGSLQVGDVSVFVGVASGHRADALEACRWLIDTLKAEVPIFKREFYADGGISWIEEGAGGTGAPP